MGEKTAKQNGKKRMLKGPIFVCSVDGFFSVRFVRVKMQPVSYASVFAIEPGTLHRSSEHGVRW